MVSAIRRSTAPAAPHAVPMAALSPGQGTHGHGDHQRVVPGQQQVDQDDREDTEQEVAYGHGALRPADPRLGAAEVALGRTGVFQDLRLERLRRFECALVADAPQKLQAQAAGDRRACSAGVSSRKRLDGKLVARPESGAVPRCW